MRVAMIGAGVAGLCSAYHVTKAFPQAEVVIFEATSHIGGTWVYTDKIQDDEFDLPMMTSMYKNLRTNLPKQVMEFSDYPIPKHYKTFMEDEEFLTYLLDYANHFDLAKYVKFRHLVTSVKVVENGWNVGYIDLRAEKKHLEKFDYVYVCNGHYNRLFVPEYKGQDIFKGGQLHSHNYRKPEYYRDKVVVVVGSGPSAQDISIDIARACKKLILSHHAPKFPSPYPSNFEQRPDLKELTQHSVIFEDGTSEEVDEILYCTGYAYYCPFLEANVGIMVERSHIRPLHRHIVNIYHPTMFFIGVPQLCCAVPMMDMQARYTVALMKGEFSLPSMEKLMEQWTKEYDERSSLGTKKQDIHILGKDESKYYEELQGESGVKRVPKVFSDIRSSTMQTKVNLYTYRNYEYTIIDDNTFVKTYLGH